MRCLTTSNWTCDVQITLLDFYAEIMQVKEIKTLLKEQTKEVKRHIDASEKKFERHIDVLKEDFDSKVSLIAEQYDSIDKKYDKIMNRLDSHSEMIASNAVMLTAAQKNIEIMKADIGFIKAGLKKKVDSEEFETLERRVALLEAKA